MEEKKEVKDPKTGKKKKPVEGIVNPSQVLTSVSGGDSDSDSFPETETSKK